MFRILNLHFCLLTFVFFQAKGDAMYEFKQEGSDYYVSIKPDVFLLETLKIFAKDRGIWAASLSGLGFLKNQDLAFYDIVQKKYLIKHFSDPAELLSLNGNIGILDEKPFIHAHVVLGNRNYETFGGHLIEAEVAAAAEIHIHTFKDITFFRKLNCNFNLNMLDFKI